MACLERMKSKKASDRGDGLRVWEVDIKTAISGD
jgi:hypothetical protein